jgi:hypothetical protein
MNGYSRMGSPQADPLAKEIIAREWPTLAEAELAALTKVITGIRFESQHQLLAELASNAEQLQGLASSLTRRLLFQPEAALAIRYPIAAVPRREVGGFLVQRPGSAARRLRVRGDLTEESTLWTASRAFAQGGDLALARETAFAALGRVTLFASTPTDSHLDRLEAILQFLVDQPSSDPNTLHPEYYLRLEGYLDPSDAAARRSRGWTDAQEARIPKLDSLLRQLRRATD